MDCGGAGVDDPLHVVLMGERGLERRERADDVDLRAQDRVGPAGGGLQACEMKDMSCLHRSDGRAQGVDVGDVALQKGDCGLVFFIEDQVEPVGVFLEVEDPDSFTGLAQLLGDPGSDAAVTAGHQYPHLGDSLDRKRIIASQEAGTFAHQPDWRPQIPGVTSSSRFPPGSRK